ncbi:MAG: HotDog domain-containing protein [Monoraphidium minutum]|nr:MAG: HotDog domain-containing protein [Monoraphidium minutum]
MLLRAALSRYAESAAIISGLSAGVEASLAGACGRAGGAQRAIAARAGGAGGESDGVGGRDGFAAASAPQQDRYIGAYTPVTKRLWAERLQWHTRGEAAQAPGAPAPAGAAPGPRPPEATGVVYPFTADEGLVECYANPWRGVRIGRLLEDLDSLAGSVALRHCAVPGRRPPHLVTAGVDAIHLKRPLLLDRDLTLEGQVAWTGRSSLDIRMTLAQPGPHPGPSLVAIFSFVSLGGDGRATAVPPLAPATDEQRVLFAERQAVADARKAARAAAAAKGGDLQVPLAVQAHLDELVAAARVVRDVPALASPHDMLMAQTRLENTFTCQPQQRNPYGRVFGGFLLRRAFELGFATCYLFAGSRPVFDCVDDVQFKKPVDVGDLMRLRSCVLHAEGDRVVVVVEASVIAPERLASSPTNAFTFTFRAAPSGAHSRLRRVLPGGQSDLRRLEAHFADL